MSVHQTRQQDTNSLSCGHDERENNRAEHRDGVKYEQLSDGRAHGQYARVYRELHVSEEEEQGCEEGSSEKQRADCEYAGEEINTEHHLHRGHLVGLEQLRLPVGREAVERHVANQNDHTGEGGLGRVLFLGARRVGGQ